MVCKQVIGMWAGGLLALGACENRTTPSPGANPAASSAAPAAGAASAPAEGTPGWFWANYSKADWAAVGSPPAGQEMDAFFRVCRFMDRTHPGETAPVELFCDGNGTVYDREGNRVSTTLEGWKSIHGFIAQTGLPNVVMRASMPLDYADGLGEIQRHGYRVTPGPLMTLEFESIGPIEGSTRG